MGWLQQLIGRDGAGATTDSNGVPISTAQAKQRLGGVTPQANFLPVFKMYCENDAGSVTGSAYIKSPYISEDNRFSVGIDTTQALFNFTSNIQNTGKLKYANSVMTATQSSGFLNLNPALATGSGNYVYMQSDRYFTVQGDGVLRTQIVGQITAALPANQIFEVGYFLGTAGVAPADGVFFRLTNAGLIGVMTYNGVETPTGILLASIPINTNGQYRILVSQREISFWAQDASGADVLLGEIAVPAGNAVPFQSLCLPLTFMMRNSGIVTGGSIVKIGTAPVTQTDLATYQPWGHQMAGQGNCYQGQDGDTQGKTSLWTNNTAPIAVALTNTTAAFTGLGGITAVLPTLAIGTDGILINFTNPIGSISQPAKTYMITGVTLQGTVSVVLAGGAVAYACAVAYGHTAIALTTAESGSFVSPTTKSPRIIPIGIQNFPITSSVGVTANLIDINFEDSSFVINPGENISIILRNVGIVTTTGAITFVTTFKHHIY